MNAPPGMAAFYIRFPDLGLAETRTLSTLASEDGLPAGNYAFMEFYCDDPPCDCRRVLFKVWAQNQPGATLATINFGWESVEFYTRWLHGDKDSAREITAGSLDPMNPQSPLAPMLLGLFRTCLLPDAGYVARLERHYQMFKGAPAPTPSGPLPPLPMPPTAPASKPSAPSSPQSAPAGAGRIPADRRARFDEVAALLESFGGQHLDPELTGFMRELWARICRRRDPGCLRGKANVWAATVAHVIARMNFLFDRAQPVHVTFDTICGFFQASKTTIGSKATEIERTHKLRAHSEPGICRGELLETFTMLELSNGMVLTWKMARQMGYLPPEARIEDLR